MDPSDSRVIKKIYVPSDIGLYNKESAEFLSKIENALEPTTESQKVICFLQTGPNTDLNPNLYDQLYHNVTFDDVYDRLLQVRRLLAKLQHSPHVTVFSSFFDCKGSVFELFLSCDYRLNFDEYCVYGFEEIEGDFFPCAGAFEYLVEGKSRSVERFKDTGTILAKEAAKLDLIHFSINGDNHFELTDSWLANNSSSLESRYTNKRSLRRRSSGLNIDRLSLDKQKLNKLKIDLTTDYCFQNRSPRAFPFCENLISNHPKGLSDPEMRSLVTYMCARYTLTPRFKGWFKSRLQKRSSVTVNTAKSEITPVFSVYPYVPPAQPLLNALLGGQKLIFYSSSSTHLKNGIDLFIGRLEHQVGKEKSLKILRNQINWFISDENSLLGYQVVFEPNSQFSVRRGERTYRFYHTLNSKIDHDAIFAEYPKLGNENLSKKVERLVMSFCRGIFQTETTFPLPLPLIYVVRSLFLQEMKRLCDETHQSIDFVLESLKIAGWRFAAEPSSWEKFLRGRQSFLTIEEKDFESFVVPIDTELWRVGLWKQIRKMLKPERQGAHAPSSTFVSRHMMAYCRYLHDSLQTVNTGLTLENLDQLICSSIGVPENYGNIERYSYVWGDRRLTQYIDHHWRKS